MATLARFPLFRSLDADAIRRLDQACAWRRASARQWVLDHAGAGTELFFVVQGHVRVTLSAGARETILRDIRDGEFFGELAALDGQPRSAGIVAITDTVLASMPASVFRRAVHEHPDVCDQLLGVLVGQIRTLANRAGEASSLDARHRLHAELLRLARPRADGDGTLIVSPPPTHAELAARVNSHREAVTRELNVLERAQLIRRQRGAISLLDPERLRRMIAGSASA